MELFLKTGIHSFQLGKTIAKILQKTPPCALLFQGELGSGKTTLIKAIVENLKGGEKAEVSSPSFNLFNIYPTIPEVIHIDFYRCQNGYVDEEVFDYIYSSDKLIMIEWPEFLSERLWPDDFLLFTLYFINEGRKLVLKHCGKKAATIYHEIVSSYPS